MMSSIMKLDDLPENSLTMVPGQIAADNDRSDEPCVCLVMGPHIVFDIQLSCPAIT